MGLWTTNDYYKQSFFSLFFCTEFMIIAHVEEGGSKTVGVNEIYVMKAYRTNNEN